MTDYRKPYTVKAQLRYLGVRSLVVLLQIIYIFFCKNISSFKEIICD